MANSASREDIEIQRSELLRLIDMALPAVVLQAIRVALAALPTPEPPNVFTTHQGAFDADQG